jgi:hypothetical protein
LLNFIALVFNFPLQFEAFVEEKLKTPLEQERINHEKFLSNREIPDTSAENRENIADRIQTEFVLPQKSAKNNNTFLSFTLVFLLLLILPASFLFFKMYFRYINAETKITEIENLAFYPKEVGKDVVEVDFVSMKKADNKKAQENPTQKAQDEISLSFFTNNIFNKSFIYTQNTWDFETDKRGEDMNSEYGAPYNEEIRHLKPDKITAPTLANQQIWIRFNIKNNGKTKIFVDNIALKILNRYDLKEDEVSYDVWFPKSLDEKAVEITLNNFAATYPLSTHTELDANESRFFSLKVFGDESLKKRLIKFRLIVSCTDGAGSRQTIHSDKDYFVGFLPPL